MTYPSAAAEPVLDMVSSLGPWGPLPWALGGSPVSTTWEVANRTVYQPIYVPTKCQVQRFWWANGATVSGAATIVAGIYRDTGGWIPGVRLESQSATQGTASQVQFVTPSTAPILVPGLYWLALASSSATNTTILASAFGLSLVLPFKFQEATGTPPATATPVKAGAQGIYLFGFSTQTSP